MLRTEFLSRVRSMRTLALLLCMTLGSASGVEPAMHDHSATQDTADPLLIQCVPNAERAARELGCYILDSPVLGRLPEEPLYWYLDTYKTRSAAEGAKGKNGSVVGAFGKIWLFTIANSSLSPADGGHRVARIGPLGHLSDRSYTAVYMEATFVPGMHTVAHRHPGPEAWYVLAGEQCLETPGHRMVVRAGESGIVPEGQPMILTGTGTSQRRSLVLILQDSSKPMRSLAPDWKPAGLCTTSP